MQSSSWPAHFPASLLGAAQLNSPYALLFHTPNPELLLVRQGCRIMHGWKSGAHIHKDKSFKIRLDIN